MQISILALFTSLVASKPTVYFIRHGEKPADGDGLSAQGEQRAQCLRTVFGKSSPYEIGHIMAQKPKKNGSQQRPYDTVVPLAGDLGLTVDTTCQRDDSECVAEIVNDYNGNGNILICWEHKRLNNLAGALGAQDVDNYPDVFNIVWTDPYPYNNITDKWSENCQGLDNYAGRGRFVRLTA